MLDVSVRIGVLNLMRSLCEEQGISMLYITHDLASARYLADRIVVMFAGEFVEGGDAMELLANPAHPYTRLLISAVPDPKRTEPFDAVERAQLRREVLQPTECPWTGKAAEPCSTETPVFHRLSEKPEHWVRCGLYAPPADAPGTALEQAPDDEENDAA
jgi:peptide/nickel transport system ATP-binding protein